MGNFFQDPFTDTHARTKKSQWLRNYNCETGDAQFLAILSDDATDAWWHDSDIKNVPAGLREGTNISKSADGDGLELNSQDHTYMDVTAAYVFAGSPVSLIAAGGKTSHIVQPIANDIRTAWETLVGGSNSSMGILPECMRQVAHPAPNSGDTLSEYDGAWGDGKTLDEIYSGAAPKIAPLSCDVNSAGDNTPYWGNRLPTSLDADTLEVYKNQLFAAVEVIREMQDFVKKYSSTEETYLKYYVDSVDKVLCEYNVDDIQSKFDNYTAITKIMYDNIHHIFTGLQHYVIECRQESVNTMGSYMEYKGDPTFDTAAQGAKNSVTEARKKTDEILSMLTSDGDSGVVSGSLAEKRNTSMQKK